MYFNGITAYNRMVDEMGCRNWYYALWWAHRAKGEGRIVSDDTWEEILKGVVMLDELGFVDDSPFSRFVKANENAENICKQMEVL